MNISDRYPELTRNIEAARVKIVENAILWGSEIDQIDHVSDLKLERRSFWKTIPYFRPWDELSKR